MSRYNSNYGSHDQLQDLRKLNMSLHHELDAIKRLLDETTKELHQAQDELTLAIEALVRARGDKP
jgi:predicted  nucleic acid-binding Zn-ribbon protein